MPLFPDTIVIMYVYVRVLPAIRTFHYLFVRHENIREDLLIVVID
jgi:hypothetical protein